MKSSATLFLLVEDDANDVLFVETEFKRSAPNARLTVVHDGIEAKRYLEGSGTYSDRNKHPVPDVILLDLKMPRFSGFDFLEWLRDQSPNLTRLIPVIVLSSSPLQADVTRAYALGANAYVVKPVDWNLFRDRISTMATFWSKHAEKPPAAFHKLQTIPKSRPEFPAGRLKIGREPES